MSRQPYKRKGQRLDTPRRTRASSPTIRFEASSPTTQNNNSGIQPYKKELDMSRRAYNTVPIRLKISSGVPLHA
jgi:hypothetical protein